MVAPFDPAVFKPYATKMLDSSFRWDQLWAACLIVAADDFKTSFDKLDEIISAKEQFSGSWRYALEVLGSAKSDRAKKLISKIISGKRLLGQPSDGFSWQLREQFIPKLYSGGFSDEILKFYDALLDDTTPWPYAFEDKDLRSNDYYGREMIDLLKSSDESLHALAEKPGKIRDKIPDLKKWIVAKLNEPKK